MSAWTPNEVALLRQMEADGVMLKDIEDALGRSCSSVARQRGKLGLRNRPVRSGKVPQDPARIAMVNRLVAEGVARSGVAERLGITLGTVSGIMARHRDEALNPALSPPDHAAAVSAGRRRVLAERKSLARKAAALMVVETAPPPCPSEKASAAAVVQGLAAAFVHGAASTPVPQHVAPSLPRAKSCFWTEGQPGAFVCCDADALRGSLFCLEHHKRGTVGEIATRHREAHRARAAA
jgi:hypothetical protein